jgi:hypothetical protein
VKRDPLESLSLLRLGRQYAAAIARLGAATKARDDFWEHVGLITEDNPDDGTCGRLTMERCLAYKDHDKRKAAYEAKYQAVLSAREKRAADPVAAVTNVAACGQMEMFA